MLTPEEMRNKIICGDALDVLKTMPDECVDLIVADPPYGICCDEIAHKQSGEKYGNAKTKKGTYRRTQWDTAIPSKACFNEMRRVSRNQIIFGGNYFVEYLSNSSCWLVWDKNNGSNNFADCELAWTSFNCAVRKFTFTWNGMIQESMKCKELRVHPAQKPIGLMLKIIDRFSEKGQLIVEPYAGMAPACTAAMMLERDFIGIERDKEYADAARKRLSDEMPLYYSKEPEIAQKRIDEEVSQGRLFAGG